LVQYATEYPPENLLNNVSTILTTKESNMDNKEIALTFVDGYSGKYGNVVTTAQEYRLFGHTICEYYNDGDKGIYTFDWCGWYSQSTARHMNNILKAIDSNHRVSYTKDRDSGVDTFAIYGGVR